MWPQAQIVGDGGKLQNPEPYRHYCCYKVMRSSVNKEGWYERCKCGKMAKVALRRREDEEKVVVRVAKQWFDAEGNLEKVTGEWIISNDL